jgi:hypothetical protein
MAGLLARVSWSSLERCARWDTSPVKRPVSSLLSQVYFTRSSIAGWMRSSLAWMRSSLVWMRSNLVWMRSSLVVRPSACQCPSPGFDPRILRHSGIGGAADEAVLNTVHRKKIQKIPQFIYCRWLQRDVVYRGWPIAPSNRSPNAGEGGGSCGVSANGCSCTQEPK